MASLFEQIHNFAMKWEGGLSDDAADHGGITKYGVSIEFLKDLERNKSSLLASVGVLLPIRRESVKALTREQGKALFKAEFWDKLHCDTFPPKIAAVMYDCAMNTGISRAVKIAQQALGLTVDGVLGPISRARLSKADNEDLKAIIDRRDVFYKRIVENNHSQKVFLKGWLHRTADLRRFLESLDD